MSFPDANALRCLNTVLTELRKRYRLRTYIRVSEYQKNGTIYFHILTNNYMYVRMVNRLFAKAIRHKIKEDKLQINFDFDNDIKRVDNNKRTLASYLTKYVSKNTIEHKRFRFIVVVMYLNSLVPKHFRMRTVQTSDSSSEI